MWFFMYLRFYMQVRQLAEREELKTMIELPHHPWMGSDEHRES